MTIAKTENGTEVCLNVDGRLDTTTSPELEKAIQGLGKAEKLVIDFEKLDYISSAGLRVLLSAHKAFSKKGGMVVRHANDQIMDVFEVTGFKDVLVIE